jgi:nitroreductase
METMARAKRIMDLITARKSVRKYLDKPISRKDVQTCIEAARRAPSAHNIQPWRFIVIDDEEVKKGLCAEACGGIYKNTRFIENAPVLVLLLARLDLIVNRVARAIQGTNYYLLDVGIAGEHLVLQAQELGIGTCWIGWFNSKKARKYLRLPWNYRVVSIISMGYPAEGATRRKEDLPMDEILFFNLEGKGRL